MPGQHGAAPAQLLGPGDAGLFLLCPSIQLLQLGSVGFSMAEGTRSGCRCDKGTLAPTSSLLSP